MRLTKLTATLFATTMMAMVALPEAAFGAGQTAQYHQAKTAQAKKERDALANPTAIFAVAAAPGNMNHALAAAVADVGSAAHGLPLGTDAEKATALHVVVNSGNAADDPHKLAIRKALALTADPSDTPKLDAFVAAAQEKLVHPGVHAGAVAAHTASEKLANALLDPNAAITAAAAAGNLGGVIHDATLAAPAVPMRGGAPLAANGIAHGMPVGTIGDQIAVLAHILAGGPSDDLTALEGALGTNDPAKIRRFIDIANFELVAVPRANVELHGIAGANVLAKLVEIKRRINAATRTAKAPHGPAVGGAAADINTALGRISL